MKDNFYRWLSGIMPRRFIYWATNRGCAITATEFKPKKQVTGRTIEEILSYLETSSR